MKAKAKVYGVDRLPRRVRAHFPKAKTVSDSTAPIAIHVAPRDQKKAVANDPSACAMARACAREEKADGAWVGISVAYVLKGTHLTRYLTPPSVAREIVSFDRHQDFSPGAYRLSAVPKSLTHRMGTHTRRSTGAGKPKPRGTHVIKRHRTIGIRKGSNAS